MGYSMYRYMRGATNYNYSEDIVRMARSYSYAGRRVRSPRFYGDCRGGWTHRLGGGKTMELPTNGATGFGFLKANVVSIVPIPLLTTRPQRCGPRNHAQCMPSTYTYH